MKTPGCGRHPDERYKVNTRAFQYARTKITAMDLKPRSHFFWPSPWDPACQATSRHGCCSTPLGRPVAPVQSCASGRTTSRHSRKSDAHSLDSAAPMRRRTNQSQRSGDLFHSMLPSRRCRSFTRDAPSSTLRDKKQRTPERPLLRHRYRKRSAYPTQTRALRNIRSHGESPAQSFGAQLKLAARRVRSGCGIMIVARPSRLLRPAMPSGEPLGLSG